MFIDKKINELNFNEVHIWCTSLDEKYDYTYLKNYLSESELNKVNRFKIKSDNINAIVRKALSKYLLSYYLKMPIQSITLKYSYYNKPEFSGINFNSSHSKNKIVLAFSLNKNIGIDIEEIKYFEGMDQVAKSYFAKEEYEHYKYLNKSQRIYTFFRIWTSKEAFIKAIGNGFTYPIQNFIINPFSGTRMTPIILKELSNQNWFNKRLQLFDSFASAIAFNGEEIKISVIKFDINKKSEVKILDEL